MHHPDGAKLVEAQVDLVRKLPKNVYTTGSPGLRGLLALPPLDATARFLDVVSMFQLFSALVLSGLLGMLFDPLDVATLPADRHTLGHAFNLTASTLTVMTILTCATTTWASQAVAGQTEDTIGAAMAKSIKGFHYCVEVPQYVQVVLCQALVVLAAYVHQPAWVARATLAMAVCVHFACVSLFFSWTGYAFPTVMLPWVYSNGMPFLAPRKRPLKEMVENVKTLIVESMLTNHGVPQKSKRYEVESSEAQGEAVFAENATGTPVDEESEEDRREKASLGELVATALPAAAAARHAEIVVAMQAEGLTKAVLEMAAQPARGGSGALLFGLLGELAVRPRLRLGDRIAIMAHVEQK